MDSSSRPVVLPEAADTRAGLSAVVQPELIPAVKATGRTDAIAPVAPRDRVLSIDVLRGVAVLGILLMNVVSMGLPFAAYDDPTIAGNRSSADFWAWALGSVLAEGKMRAIFSMLFGAGVLLIARRAEARDGSVGAADLHLRRNLWLLPFGAVHSYLLLWPGEILFTYGVAGVPLFAFRRLRPRTLAGLGILVLALQVPFTVIENERLAEASAGLREIDRLTTSGATLTRDQQRSRDAWRDTVSHEKPTPEMLRGTIESKRGGYLRNLGSAAEASVYVESTYLYTVGLWDAGALMLIGMALLKLDVFSASRSYRFYVVMAAAGFAIGLPLGIWVLADWVRHGFEPGLRWTGVEDVTRVSMALGYVAVVMIVCKARVARGAVGLLAAVGRMALTNYVMQTVICVTLFCGFGFGWFGQLARHQLYFIVAGVWAFQLIASPLWLRWFRFGPLEWVWRSLTYLRRPVFRS